MTAFLFLLVIGAAAGFLATRLLGMDLPVPQTIALGVVGALLGGFLLRIIVGVFSGFLGALLGAVVLIWAYRTFVERR